MARFLNSKRNENLADSTLDKLTTIFEKQFWGGLLPADSHTSLKSRLPIWKAFVTPGRMARSRRKKTGTVNRILLLLSATRLDQVQSRCPAGSNQSRWSPDGLLPAPEFEKIMDATYIYQPKGWVECWNQATRLRILTLLMRWSGLAIRDAVTLERRRLNEHDELFLYRAKTGSPVYVPLPPDVAESLRNIPPGPSPNPRYFFWSGNGSPKSVFGNWQRSFRRLFKIANLRRDDGSIQRCHPHMLRDTFAVEMLLAGVPLEQVSILLGHKSVKITEKHYAPWVKARQEQLAANVRKAWNVLDTGNKTARRKSPRRVKSA